MMIRLTSFKSKSGITLRADQILFCRKSPEDKITTHVVTGIMGPKGLEAFAVEESPEQIALMVNAILGANMTHDPPGPQDLGLGTLSTLVQQ